MNTFARFSRTLATFGLALATACGATGAGDDGGGGGGNVGFGGAQDIGQFRNILDNGGIPGPETLDANGFFNEHFIELPAPDCGALLCGHAMLAVGRDWVTGEYQAALQISMNTPLNPEDIERKPLNMVVVADTSGSMAADDRIGYLRQGLHTMIDQLEPGDRLAIVEYNTEARVVARLDEELTAEGLHSRVETLVAGGSTNFHDGLQMGLAMVADSWSSDRQNRVLLVSDGQPTTGITADLSIIGMANTYIAEGIGLTTVGVGTDFNVNLMRGLAEYGAGNFYFLESPEAIDEVFIDELDFFVEPIALDVNIIAIASDGYELGEVVGTNRWVMRGAEGSVYLPAVFLASRTSATPDPNGSRGGGSAIIIRMRPQSAGSPVDPTAVAQVKISYRLPGSLETVEQVIDVTNPYDPGLTPEEAYFSHQAMAKNYAVYNIYLGLRESSRRAESNYGCSLATILQLREDAAIWNQFYEDPDIATDIALMDQFIANLRNTGAVAPDGDAAMCDSTYDPYGDGPYGDDYHGDDYGYVCSAGGTGSTTALLAILLAGVFAVRPRRRRFRSEQ